MGDQGLSPSQKETSETALIKLEKTAEKRNWGARLLHLHPVHFTSGFSLAFKRKRSFFGPVSRGGAR